MGGRGVGVGLQKGSLQCKQELSYLQGVAVPPLQSPGAVHRCLLQDK
jgi:hypothetical protein